MGLIASELMTNAVRATGTTKLELSYQEREALPFVAVRLRVSDVVLVVEVYDDSRALPRVGTAAPDAEGGRGLPLVERLSVRWRAYRNPSGGQGRVRGTAPRPDAGNGREDTSRADTATVAGGRPGAVAESGP
ncbi:hypothetical protein GCM10018785_37550 [Streptomyces longispororuber]|uniref:Regulatory protein n=1 Tax=Streptomyces longispororuber TaxID=68230 RepID=A0A918ZQB9_9ACTN|nr:hypothetical protein GCM10018785_37550 [Streptomyces longispororuber]